jgi:tetratricopeptide (TPR) repeat protein
MKKIVYIFLFIIPLTLAAQDSIPMQERISFMQGENATKSVADSAYAIGDYASAITIYENILKEGEAPEIYYNLANAYYRNDEIAKSILNYERALLLAPGDDDIRFNLALANSKIVDKVSEGYQIFLVNWLYAVINALSITAWAIIGVISFLLLLIALLLFLFNRSMTIRKIGFAATFVMLFVTLFANLSALHQYNDLTNRVEAIILSPSVTAKSTPSESGTNLFVIHEGRKVKITDDTMSLWKEIELEDGTVGWVPSSTLERI